MESSPTPSSLADTDAGEDFACPELVEVPRKKEWATITKLKTPSAAPTRMAKIVSPSMRSV